MKLEAITMTINTTNTTTMGRGTAWDFATVSEGSPNRTEPVHLRNQAKQPIVSISAMMTIAMRIGLEPAASMPPQKIDVLAEEQVHGRSSRDGKRPDTEPDAQKRLLFQHAFELGKHARSHGVAERTGDKEEQGLGERVVEDVHHAALQSQVASEDVEPEAQEDIRPAGRWSRTPASASYPSGEGT